MNGILRERAKQLDHAKLLETAAALFGRAPMTFETARDQLVEKFPGSDERAMGYAVRMQLPLVQVPTDEPWSFPANAEFTLAEQWLGEKPADSDHSEELVLRYLAAFGPASIADAQTWSGIRNLKETFAALRPKLVTFRDEKKRELFDLPKAPRPDAETPAPVRLIPDFDNLVLAHDDRSRVIADEHRPRIATKNLLIRPTFLVDGFVAGTWSIERKKKSASLVFAPFGPLKKPVRAALEEEAEQLLLFSEEDAQSREISFA
jgi:hypothetical protein